MSGIYIHGMEMPKEKKITLTLFPDGRVYENHGERLWGYGRDCIPWKAVPVPPHGRLIDADSLKQKIFSDPIVEDTDDPRFNLYTKVQVAGAVNKIIEAIDKASTIIMTEQECE